MILPFDQPVGKGRARPPSCDQWIEKLFEDFVRLGVAWIQLRPSGFTPHAEKLSGCSRSKPLTFPREHMKLLRIEFKGLLTS